MPRRMAPVRWQRGPVRSGGHCGTREVALRRSPQALLVGYLALTLACPTAGPAAAEVREFTLDNGLKLIVQEDHRAPVEVSQVWYKVGSSYEHEGITGVSHALEHMMFLGTEGRRC